ncbi:MAG: hypothetical protein WC359_15275, partial [Dehalococcoidia bacterium]
MDKEGKPLVAYHGTVGDFTTFAPGGNKPSVQQWETAGRSRSMIGESGRAFFFSTKPTDIPAAHHYSDTKPGANIMPVYLSVQNPLIFDSDTKDWAIEVIGEGNKEFPLLVTDEAYRNLQHNGYDGVFVYHEKASAEWRLPDEIVVLSNKQIKSATGNSGAFDWNNPDITKSLKAANPSNAVPSSTAKWDKQVVQEIRPIWFGLFKKGGDRALKQIRKFPKHARKMVVFGRGEMAASVGVDVMVKGGPGSGNFGHEGRPGEVGGSGPGGGSGILLKPEDI